MNLEQLKKTLAKKISPVWLVVGPSAYEIGQIVGIIGKAALGTGAAGFNLDRFRAGEDDLAKIPKIARTYPMMAKRRVIILSGAERLSPDSTKTRTNVPLPQDFAAVLGLLARENIDTCCLIVCGEKFDKRTAFAKTARDNDALIELGKPTSPQVSAWIRHMAAERGKEVSFEAESFLLQQWMTDLVTIDKEIEKAALFAGAERKTIEAEDIRTVMVAPKTENIFELMDAIGHKERAKAFFFLYGMLEAGTKPLKLASSIYGHMKKMFAAREYLAGGLSTDQAVQAVGGHPFAAQKIVEQCRQYSLTEIRRAIAVLSRTDFELKNGRVSDRTILEKMILDLCRGSGSL